MVKEIIITGNCSWTFSQRISNICGADKADLLQEGKDHQCKCVNLDPIDAQPTKPFYIDQPWLIIALAIAVIGVIISFMFLVWIVCCKSMTCWFACQLTESSQVFTMLLLIGMTFQFGSILSFALYPGSITCFLRFNCVPFTHAMVLSTMLSRSGEHINTFRTNSRIL